MIPKSGIRNCIYSVIAILFFFLKDQRNTPCLNVTCGHFFGGESMRISWRFFELSILSLEKQV